MAGKAQPRLEAAPPSIAGARWVPLTQGRFALVDEGDFSRVIAHSWLYAKNRENYGVARTKLKGEHAIRLPHFVLGISSNVLIDHKNRDTLDNRRSNLRVASHTQNGQNRARVTHKTSSQFKGVYPHKTGWRAGLRINTRQTWLGIFLTEVEAARAYNTAAQKHFGEFARLNPLPELAVYP